MQDSRELFLILTPHSAPATRKGQITQARPDESACDMDEIWDPIVPATGSIAFGKIQQVKWAWLGSNQRPCAYQAMH